jgi:hypothetical protein
MILEQYNMPSNKEKRVFNGARNLYDVGTGKKS